MAILDNPRQEKFCQLRARNMAQGNAYSAAGFLGTASAASQLGKSTKIKARIAEIRMEAEGKMKGIEAAKELALRSAQDAMQLDAEWVKRELMENVTAARLAGDMKNANEGVRLGAQIIGLLPVDKGGAVKPPANNPDEQSAGDPSHSGHSLTVQAFDQVTVNMVDNAGQLRPVEPPNSALLVEADADSFSEVEPG